MRRIMILSMLFASMHLIGQSPLPEKIKIGCAISLTGKYQVEGKECKTGYDIWAQWINQQGGITIAGQQIPVEIIYEDDKSEPGSIAAKIQYLVDEHQVHFLFGPYSSDMTHPAAEAALRTKRIMLSGNASAEIIYTANQPYVYGVTTPARNYLTSTLQLLADSGVKTLAVAHEEELFSTAVDAGLPTWAKEFGLEIRRTTSYPHLSENVEVSVPEQVGATKRFKSIISEFKNINADAFIGIGHFYDAERFVRTARDLNFKPKAFVTTEGPVMPKFVQELGDAANYVICPVEWHAAMKYKDQYFGTPADYVNRYKAYTGYEVPPSFDAPSSTVCGLVLQLCIQRAGSVDTHAVIKQLQKFDEETFFGRIRFEEGKNTGKPMGVTQIQNQQIVLVGPKDIAPADAKLIYPMPGSTQEVAKRPTKRKKQKISEENEE